MRLAELRLGGLRLAEASPLPVVGAISPRPVLFVHGVEDLYVPPADQTALYTACGQPKAMWQAAGVGHRQAYQRDPEAWRERVIGFFRRWLLAAGR